MKRAMWIIAVTTGWLLAQFDVIGDLKPLKYFEGSWSCEGKFVQNNAPISADMTFTSELRGAWLTAVPLSAEDEVLADVVSHP